MFSFKKIMTVVIFLNVLGVGMLGVTPPAYAENITYPGYTLKPDPIYDWYDALYPNAISNNNVFVYQITNGASVPTYIAGGFHLSRSVTNNKVFITPGVNYEATEYVFGGASYSGAVSKNTIEIKGDAGNHTKIGGVYNWGNNGLAGGYTYYGSVTNNTVSVGGNVEVCNIAGGYSEFSGAVTDNKLTISAGGLLTKIHGDAAGGYSYSGTVKNNTFTIDGKVEISGRAVGGANFGSGSVTGNNLIINGGGTIINGWVFGGVTDRGSATGNKLNINGSATIDGDIYGGYSEYGAATGNNITIKSNGNTVTILDGDFPYIIGGYSNTGAAKNNTLDIGGNVIIGDSDSDKPKPLSITAGSSTSKEASGNKLTINAGNSPTEIYGDAAGGYSDTGVIKNNTLTISGKAQVVGQIAGGASVISGTVSNNSVFLNSEANVLGPVYGGASGYGSVTNNNLNIGGNVTIGTSATSATGRIFGGYSESPSGSTVISGNKLNIDAATAPTYIYGAAIGGYGNNGAIKSNTVNITGNVRISKHVSGGASDFAGVVTNNTVNIKNVTYIGGNVDGGDSISGAVSGNAVNINGSATIGGNVGGGFSESGDVTNNKVTVNGAAINSVNIGGALAGGYSLYGKATGNTVNINKATISSDIYGGTSDSGLSTGNKVTLNNSSIGGSVYGGASAFGTAASNTVSITNSDIAINVYGSASYYDDSSLKNPLSTVTIKDSIIGGVVFGASSQLGSANTNKVTITNSTIGGLYGAYVNDYGNAAKNNVTLTNVTSNGYSQPLFFAGAYSAKGSVEANTLTIKGTTQLGSNNNAAAVYGGQSISGFVTNNTVTVGDNAKIFGILSGGFSSTGEAGKNKVTINGKAEVSEVYGGVGKVAQENKVTISGNANIGLVVGGWGNDSIGSASKNTVSISGAKVTIGYVYGGYLLGNTVSNPGSVNNNTVTITSSTVGSVGGGYNNVGDANGNQVKMSNAVSTGDTIFGGVGLNATSNIVNLSNVTMNNAAQIYGGDGQNSTGNTVTFSGNTKINGDTIAIYGGYGQNSSTGNTVTFSGNTNISGDIIEICGGDSATGTGNTVTLNGNTKINGNAIEVYGGSADSLSETNKLNIKGNTQIGAAVNDIFRQENINNVSETTFIAAGKSYYDNATGNNLVIGDKTKLFAVVAGGISLGGTAENNTTTINGSAQVVNAYGGFGEIALKNTIIIGGKAQVGRVTGGESASILGKVIDNTVNITGGKVGNVQGGFIDIDYEQGSDTLVQQNSVNITSATTGNVYGGYNSIGSAAGNKVKITNSTVSGDFVIGGEGTTAENNEVIINGSSKIYVSGLDETNNKIDGGLYGGYGRSGLVTGNNLDISGSAQIGKTFKNIFDQDNTIDKITESCIVGGGFSESGDVSSNSVYVKGNAKVFATTAGGASMDGSASYNYLYIGGSAQVVNAYGGVAANGSATNNTVRIDGNAQVGRVTGGEVMGGSIGDVTDNFVSIEGSTKGTKLKVGNVQGGFIDGNGGSGSVNNNTVNITNANVAGNVFGGFNSVGEASGNSVYIKNSSVSGEVIGGTGTNSANNNVITLENTTVTYNGGNPGAVYGGLARSGSADWNTIYILGTTKLVGGIFGGYAMSGTDTASNNSIIISGKPNLSASRLYGSNYNDLNNGGNNKLLFNDFTGSVLSLANFHTVTVNNSTVTLTDKNWQTIDFATLNNYGTINFHNGITETQININNYSGTGTLGIEVNKTSSDHITITNAQSTPKIAFKFLSGGKRDVELGEVLTITNSTPSFARANILSTGVYTPVVRVSNQITEDGLYSTVYNLETFAFDQALTKPYSEVSAAALAQASNGFDNVLDNSLKAAESAAPGSPGIYLGDYYTNDRYKSGSHADIRGNNGGLAIAFNNAKLTYGIAGEYFSGNYNTVTDVVTNGKKGVVNTNGTLKNTGGAIFFYYRPNGGRMSDAGTYYNLTLRKGNSEQDMNVYGENIIEPSSLRNKRDYEGISFGGGSKKIANNRIVDFYSRAIYTRLSGQEVIDSERQKINFAAADSLRLVAGLRQTMHTDKKFRPFIGAALDYEFNGKPDVYINGIKAENKANLSGLSALAELGCSYHLKNLQMNLSLQGHLGQREGFAAMFNIIGKF